MAEPIIVRLEGPTEATAEAWIWRALLEWRRMVVSFVIAAAVAAVALAFFLDPEYEATAVVGYSQENGAEVFSNLGSRLGGLSALAGLQSANVSDTGALARAMLESRVAAQQLIQRNELLPKLFRGKWDEAKQRWRSNDPDNIPTL